MVLPHVLRRRIHSHVLKLPLLPITFRLCQPEAKPVCIEIVGVGSWHGVEIKVLEGKLASVLMRERRSLVDVYEHNKVRAEFVAVEVFRSFAMSEVPCSRSVGAPVLTCNQSLRLGSGVSAMRSLPAKLLHSLPVKYAGIPCIQHLA